MKRFADIFVIVCILVVAASSAVSMRFQLGVDWPAALGGGAVVFGLLTMLQMHAAHRRDREREEAGIAAVSRDLDKLRSALESIERRVVGLEVGGQRKGGPEEIEAVVAEIEVMGALVRQVVETMADLEMKVMQPPIVPVAIERLPTDVGVRAPRPIASAEPSPAAAVMVYPEENPLLPKRFAHLGEAGFLDLVRRSIEANRIDIYLQPIVTLPQRRVRFYEALTRLRTEDGETIYPSDYIPLAEAHGVMPVLDNQILFRTVQILKRLSSRTKEIGLFCNISVTSLSDTDFFREFVTFLQANKSNSDTLVFEFTQRAMKTMGPIEYEGLSALYDLGFRFSVDQITDMKPGFQLLAERGFRFAKISSERILNRVEDLGTEIHPADLSSYFARFGIDLVVDHIETEAQVVDILEFGVRYGQGFVFSPPRPVRSEVVQPAESKAADPKPATGPKSALEARPAPEAKPAAEARPAASSPRRSAARPVAQRQ